MAISKHDAKTVYILFSGNYIFRRPVCIPILGISVSIWEKGTTHYHYQLTNQLVDENKIGHVARTKDDLSYGRKRDSRRC